MDVKDVYHLNDDKKILLKYVEEKKIIKLILFCKFQSQSDKRWKDIRWKRWDPSVTLKTVIRPSNTNEIEQLISDMKIPLASNATQDKRICAFCNGVGDLMTNGPGRYGY